MLKNSTPAVAIESGNDYYQGCWSASFEQSSNTFQLKHIDCSEELKIVCYKFLQSCDSDKTNDFQSLDSILNPKNSFELKQNVLNLQENIRRIFKEIDFKASYESWMTNLWQSSLPCFDTVNVTAAYNGERSLIKACWWKGKSIPCSAIFTKVATDQGICCAFNAEAAKRLYSGKTYANLIKKLHDRDLKNAFENASSPKDFLSGKEPQSQAGVSKGLTIILDAHSDLLAPSSVDVNFKGFQGLVSGKGEFPNVLERGFIIQPGKITYVAMTASIIEAKSEIRNLEPWRRQCIFIDETTNLTLHKEYSPQNCLFECSQNYTRQKMLEYFNSTCYPWIFPMREDYPEICDPWEKRII